MLEESCAKEDVVIRTLQESSVRMLKNLRKLSTGILRPKKV